jgi:hypothetical protein
LCGAHDSRSTRVHAHSLAEDGLPLLVALLEANFEDEFGVTDPEELFTAFSDEGDAVFLRESRPNRSRIDNSSLRSKGRFRWVVLVRSSPVGIRVFSMRSVPTGAGHVAVRRARED